MKNLMFASIAVVCVALTMSFKNQGEGVIVYLESSKWSAIKYKE